jgi:hypothetical protein
MAYAIPSGTTTVPTVIPTPHQLGFARIQFSQSRFTDDKITVQPLQVIQTNPLGKRKELTRIGQQLAAPRCNAAEPLGHGRFVLDEERVVEEKRDSPRVTSSSTASFDLVVWILRTALASSWARARAGQHARRP